MLQEILPMKIHSAWNWCPCIATLKGLLAVISHQTFFKKSSRRSGIWVSLFQKICVCVSTDVCEVKLQSSQRERWTEAAITVWFAYMCLPLYPRREIYCQRCLWATNSHCSDCWIDRADVQSEDLWALRGDKACWSATEILLLNLKIPPFSRAHLSHLSVSFVPRLRSSLCVDSLFGKQCTNSNLSNQYEFMQTAHTSCWVYLSSVQTKLLSLLLFRERLFISWLFNVSQPGD